MKTRFKPIMLLRNDEQKVVADGYPYLRVDSITGCAVEGLDVEMLLDPLEEYLNLPSVTVKLGNRDCLKREVIGQKPIYRSFPKVLVHNESERVRILFGRVISYKSDGLVRDDTGLGIHFPGFMDLVSHIVFRPRHEESVVEMEVLVKRIKTDVSLVHKVIRTRFDRDFIHYLGVVDGTFRYADECGDRTSEIHQRMHFDGSFSMMEGRPGAQRETKVDGGVVKSIYHLVQSNAKLLSLIKILCSLHQTFSKVLIDTPILLLVRFCQGGLGHCLEARPVQILSAEVKCSLNISQSGTVGELRKAHYQELIPAVEPDRMPVAAVTVDTLLEFVFVDERHDLRKDGFTLVHDLRTAA